MIRYIVKQFIVENILDAEDSRFQTDASLWRDGLIDSVELLDLVMFLEETFEIVVEDEDIASENLDSLEEIVRFVERKRRSHGIKEGVCV